MSALPERYQRYAQTGQRPVQTVALFQSQPVELYDERDPVVWIPGAYGEMVPVRKSQAPATIQAAPVRDLTPQPLFDPAAQRMVGAGIGTGIAGAGLGWGLGQAAAGIAALGSSSAVVVMLALWLLAKAGGRGGSYTRIENHTHVQQKWFGRNTNNL